MNPNINTPESPGDKRLPEPSAQILPHTFTTIQNIPGLPNIVQSTVQTIQPPQNVINTITASSAIVGKSIAVELNPKLSLMKSVVQTGAASTGDASKITTLCSVGPAVRIIPPGALSTVERQAQPQVQAQSHVPRGPAAVANISAPRSTVATPIVRACTGQTVVPISRAGVMTASTGPYPPKTSVVYAQPQRHPAPAVTHTSARPPSAVYPGQQPRLVAPVQARPVQVVTSVPAGTPSRLLTPALQPNSAITRIPVTQSRPSGPTVVTAVPHVQAARQTIQTTQQTTRVTTGTTRVTTVAATPVVGTASRITPTASMTVQSTIGRPFAIAPIPGAAAGTFHRVSIPAGQVQQYQNRLQTVTNIGPGSRVIATTANPSNVARVTPTPPTSMARITGMLPITTARTLPTIVKPGVPGEGVVQSPQIKPTVQPTPLRVTSTNIISTTTATTTITPSTVGTSTPTPTTPIIVTNSNITNNSPTSIITQSSLYTQYRQTPVQPVRLLVEPNHDEGHGKSNASPRPSILRKRDYDNSPTKGAAKNLVPILTSMSSNAVPPPSPPSPRNDRDGGGCHSSGSTTVSATSSPGLDEEIEPSRININHTMEMSPRKKPRKQQLTSVEFTESRCTEEEMQFITELRRDREDMKDMKFCIDRKMNPHQDMRYQTPVVKTKPALRMIESSWKNRWGGRLNHYRRQSDVRPKEERRPTITEIAQQTRVLQKIHGWKVHQLAAQIDDLVELENQVHEKLKTTLSMLESQQPKSRQDDGIERANELIKGNMQRSRLICEGMVEAKTQVTDILQHKSHVTDILQRCGNKRAQKKRDK